MGSDGGIGRHAGLKILWAEMPVRVRFPLRVQTGKSDMSLLPGFIFHDGDRKVTQSDFLDMTCVMQCAAPYPLIRFSIGTHSTVTLCDFRSC